MNKQRQEKKTQRNSKCQTKLSANLSVVSVETFPEHLTNISLVEYGAVLIGNLLPKLRGSLLPPF